MTDPRKKIDQLRTAHNMSLSQLARKLGLSETSVYNWYNEKDSMPTVKVLEDVCALFGIGMAELFADVDCDKLSAKQIELLELFGKLTESQQENVISIVRSIADSNRA
ncbi:MAG TPA: helix-turn-helix transcriptional regulator [Candidatus Coproplasma avistercoris]|nr:helix-turn-helix transcriptional regulator [Candidatus Coproplasma avistercoris]